MADNISPQQLAQVLQATAENLNRTLQRNSMYFETLAGLTQKEISAKEDLNKATNTLDSSLSKYDKMLQEGSISFNKMKNLFKAGSLDLENILKKRKEIEVKESLLRRQVAMGAVQQAEETRKQLNRLTKDYIISAQQIEGQIKLHEELHESIGGTIKEFINAKLSIAALVSGLKEIGGVTGQMMKFGYVVDKGSNVLEIFGKQLTQSVRLGLTPEDYIEITAANRQAVMAMGGTNKAFQQVNDIVGQYVPRFGDLGEASKFLYNQMTILGRAGIRPSTQNLGLLANSFNDLQKMTGLTQDQLGGVVDSLVQDQGISAQLQAASESERKVILQGIATRLKENVAMGMSVEQATAAAKALGQIAAKTPMERLREGIKLAALGGALGIAGAGELPRLLMLGARATPAEKAQQQKTISAIQGSVQGTRTGPLSAEFAASTMAQGLDDVVGPGSPFQTRLIEAFKPEGSVLQGTGVLADEHKWLGTLLSGIRQILLGLESPITKILGGIIHIAGLLVAGRALGGMLGGAGGMLGKIGGIFGGAGEAAGGAGALGTLSKAALGLGVRAGAGGLIGLGAHALGAGKYASLGAGLGGTIGTFFGPIVGTAIGAAVGGLGGMLVDKLTDSTDATQMAEDTSASKASTEAISTLMSDMKISFEKIAENTAALVELNKKLTEVNILQLQAVASSSDEKQRIYEQGKRIGKMAEASQPYMIAGYA